MSFQNILLFFPIVDVSYCNDDFILYLGDYITSQYVKATNNYAIFSRLVHVHAYFSYKYAKSLKAWLARREVSGNLTKLEPIDHVIISWRKLSLFG